MPFTIPSTAWSSAASSNTMFAALPPSSSVMSHVPSRELAHDQLPDLGRARESELVDPVVLHEVRAGDPSPVTRFTTPGGSSACRQMSAKIIAVSGVVSAGFRTTVFPQASAGAIFHASMSNGKFQGMICAATPSGLGGARKGVPELVGPARVVEEVRGGERDVDVA